LIAPGGSSRTIQRFSSQVSPQCGGIIVAIRRSLACIEKSPAIEGAAMSEERLDRIEEEIDRLRSQLVDGRVEEIAVAGGRFDRIDRGVDEIKVIVSAFIQLQSAINGKLRSRDADHERRLVALEKRRS
jgi:hypothetical protein